MTNWEASWGHVGGNWDRQDGTKFGQVEAKLINFGTNLGPSCAKLGACWGQVGAKLGQVGAKLGQVGRSWDQVGSILADLSRKLAITTQGYPTCRRKSSKMDPKSPT